MTDKKKMSRRALFGRGRSQAADFSLEAFYAQREQGAATQPLPERMGLRADIAKGRDMATSRRGVPELADSQGLDGESESAVEEASLRGLDDRDGEDA